MADSVEMQDIRGLDIDKTVKGFALREYRFKSLCNVSSMSGDSVRWYQETSTELTATTPSKVADISPLARFTTLEPTWTRNTSYVKKYGVESFISAEDMKSADIDVVARTLLRLTRAVVKQVDSDIFTVMTDTLGTGSAGINTVTSTAAWNAASGQDPIEDLLECFQDIDEYDYDSDGAVICLSPKDYKSLITWLISTKGVNVPQYASALLQGGGKMSILGRRVMVSNNVTADYALVVIPQQACTWKSYTDTTSRAIEDAGIGTKFRVWELGIAILTDPRAVALISNTQA